MFLSNCAVALAAKKLAPKASLGTLLAAALWLDILWSFLLMLGLENVHFSQGATKLDPLDYYDFSLSHSLVMILAWAAFWGLIYLIVRKKDVLGAWIIAGLVASNWVLAFIFHRPDLPLVPANPTPWMERKFGLNLGNLPFWHGHWDFPFWAILLECSLFVAGFWLYLRATQARDGIGKTGLWIFGLILAALYIAYTVYALKFAFTHPLDPRWVSLIGVVQLLFVAWAYWIDDHRKTA